MAKFPVILITGNMGYIGPMVVRELVATVPNVYIIGLDAGYFAHCLTNAKVFPEYLVREQHFCDVREVDDALLARVDAIIHLAAISNDPMGSAFENQTKEINSTASETLARRAKKAGVKRFVFASSCSMYGSSDDTPRTENSPLNPLTAYARSKVHMENILRVLSDESFSATCLRFATACGWSPRTRLDLVLNDFVASAVANGRIDVLSDGSPWRPLVHIEDMARSLVWAVGRDTKELDPFMAVNVGSEEWNYQIKDLAQAVANLVPGIEININHNAAPDKRSYRVSFELLRTIAPRNLICWDLEKTVQQLFLNLKSMAFSDKYFRESNLIRLAELRRMREIGVLNDQLKWNKQFLN